MLAGRSFEARWVKAEPQRRLDAAELDRFLQAAHVRGRALHWEALPDGLRNANFKIQLESSSGPIVLRIYEHDASLCQKETDVIRMLGSVVPVPEIIYAEPASSGGLPPFALFRFIEGITFRELKRRGDRSAIAEAARSAGGTLARIAHFEFSMPGWLGPGIRVAAQIESEADLIPGFVDSCLTNMNLLRRMDVHLRKLVHETVWRWAERLRDVSSEARLVHGDFGKRNLMVRHAKGRWRVVAVLDWEFACSGSPLADIGEFLRYERAADPLIEPHFSEGFQSAGGVLPLDWLQLARLVDFAKLCDSLTRDYLPEELVPELIELIRGIVEKKGG